MHGITSREVQIAQTIQIETVVDIPGIRTTAPLTYQLPGSQLPQVIRDEVRRLTNKSNEFVDLTVTACQCGNQTPAHLTGKQTENDW